MAQSLHSSHSSNHKPKALYQTTYATKETRGKILNFIKDPLKHYFPLGNKSKDPLSRNSSNLAPPFTTLTTAQHVGSTAPQGTFEENAPVDGISRLNPEVLEDLNERRLDHTGPRLDPTGPHKPTCAIASTERRKARSIQDFASKSKPHKTLPQHDPASLQQTPSSTSRYSP